MEALGEYDKRILVATDCLSEGVNLQAYFNAVVHYDLSWNPTRHQQRDGRVDRFGQKSEIVRTILLYGENNPIDGAVLEVILKKARTIENRTGVQVPMPDEGGSLTKALMSAVLLRAHTTRQISFDFRVDESDEAKAIDIAWTNASEKEKKARTIFAQHSLKPEEVAPEWEATQAALGSFPDVERFVSRSMMRLGAALVPSSAGGYAAPLQLTTEVLRERFVTEGLLEETSQPRSLRIAFDARPRAGYIIDSSRASASRDSGVRRFLENALDAPFSETTLQRFPAAASGSPLQSSPCRVSCSSVSAIESIRGAVWVRNSPWLKKLPHLLWIWFPAGRCSLLEKRPSHSCRPPVEMCRTVVRDDQLNKASSRLSGMGAASESICGGARSGTGRGSQPGAKSPRIPGCGSQCRR